MSDVLPVDEAWIILGKNPKSIINSIMAHPLSDRVRIIDEVLDQAKKIAKRLLAQNHPDVNNNSCESERKFKAIQLAIRSIEHHTEQFKEKANSIIAEKARIPRTVIVIGK